MSARVARMWEHPYQPVSRPSCKIRLVASSARQPDGQAQPDNAVSLGLAPAGVQTCTSADAAAKLAEPLACLGALLAATLPARHLECTSRKARWPVASVRASG
eukprot:352129-Chlamydomonas_euryale.AAC.15